MQIFGQHVDPAEAAALLANVHVGSQQRESVQLLYAAHHMHGGKLPVLPDGLTPYKLAYERHCLAWWVASNEPNYRWLHDHALALSEEWIRRGSASSEVHGSSMHLPYLATAPHGMSTDKDHYPDTIGTHTRPVWANYEFATVNPPRGCAGAPLAFVGEAREACRVTTPDGIDWTASYVNYYAYKKRTVKRPFLWMVQSRKPKRKRDV